MKTFQIVCIAAALLLAAGCNIQFNAPAFPGDTGSDVVHGDTGMDAPLTDVVGLDLPWPTCEELNGICVDPTLDDRNSQGCPWGYELMPKGDCPGDNHCCAISPHCEPAGTLFTSDADGIGCCPGLSSFDLCAPVAGFKNCGCGGDEYVCTDCGDGVCEEWENPCICLADCPWGGNECKENGGACMSECPPGHEPLDFGGCEGEGVCCSAEGTCLGKGETAEVAPGSPPCCGDLEPIPVTVSSAVEPGSECKANEAWYVCTNCGNKNCEEWESSCTCPEDCEEILPNFCEEDGGVCMENCPQGWNAVFTPGCPGTEKCCMKDEFECVEEGGQIPGGSPSDIQCCAGLVEIEDIAAGEDGECDIFLSTGIICSDCGNGGCELWENQCNCPQDCAWVIPPDGCNPNSEDSPQCPSAQFCMAPPYTCGISAPIGICATPPDNCALLGDPVCTCNGNEFDNECFAHQAMENVAWFGSCMGVDDKECVGLGEIGDAATPIAGCCGDLDKIDLVVPDPDGGDCEDASGFVCVKCEDGVCGLGENFCICPDDCMNYGTDPIPGG